MLRSMANEAIFAGENAKTEEEEEEEDGELNITALALSSIQETGGEQQKNGQHLLSCHLPDAAMTNK